MASTKSGWQQLKTTSRHKCPKLFYSFCGNANGYVLEFTDLVGLWAQKLSLQQVLDYAKETRSPVDPSDETGQLVVLYRKLIQSLAEGRNILRQDEESKTGHETLSLRSEIELPRPLQPLVWEFSLEPQQSAEMAEVILRPCLHQASKAGERFDALFEVIRAKDRVISKLLYSIQSSAIDLGSIFPGVSNPRARKGPATSIEDAQKRVSGLRPFDEDKWKQGHHSEGPYTGFEANGLANLITGCEKCPKHTTEQHTKWLNKLPRISTPTSQIARASLVPSPSPRMDPDTDSGTEFETLKRRSQRSGARTTKSSTPSPLPSPPPRPLSELPARRLATLSSGPRSHTRSGSRVVTSTETSTDEEGPRRSPLGRLGRLHKRPRLSRKETQDSLPLPSSSPPPMPSKMTEEHELGPSLNTLPNLPRSTTPQKVGKVRPGRASNVDRKAQLTAFQNQSVNEASQSQTAPTRSLGRLGRFSSKLALPSDLKTPTSDPQDVVERESAELDLTQRGSISSTASESSRLSNDSCEVDIDDLGADQLDPKLNTVEQTTQESAYDRTSEERLVQELSKEEKANQRRQELKQKLATANTQNATSDSRKRRKF